MPLQLDGINLEQLLGKLHLLDIRQRILIAFGVFFLLMLGFYLVSWKGQIEELAQNDTDIQDRHTRLASKSNLLLERLAVERELAGLEKRLPMLKQSLPTDEDLANLLEDINALIRDQNLQLAEFSPGEPKALEVMKQVPVSLSVSGHGPTIALVPLKVADLSRQVTFAKLEVTEQGEGERWRMTGELHAFAQLHPQVAPGGPQ
ncbi:MAG TPA: type 4a pilus biogenesis protein PilO [Limnobacter sp.]|nr:type 4a pilus biogenesis protein PilO [Limnobacter sp.]